MSLPNADREMLLSAALDGALSVQEQAEFDRAIASDPTFAAEFEELQGLRADLRQSFAPIRQQRLPAVATDRIVAAALAAADRVTASAADSPARPATPLSSGRIAATALALAAAALIAVTIWNRPDAGLPLAVEDGPAPVEAVAQNDVTKDSVENPPAMGGLTEPPQASPGSADLQALAANGDAVATESDPSKPKVMSIKPAPGAAPSPEAVANIGERPSNPPSAANPPTATSDPAAADRRPLQVVLVLAVELTQAGRDQLALQEALRATDIRLGQDSVMGSNVVSHLQQANVLDAGTLGDSTGKLYFIEASAKRIDRLMTYLMSNKELFASVGLSLADQPPLLAAVGDLREIDPTKVRQDNMTGVARDLVAPGGKSLSIDPNHAFLPLSRELVDSGLLPSAAPIPNGSANVIDDFPSQLLLFVK